MHKANEPSLEWLENPEIFAVNRLEAVSDHKYYPDWKSASQAEEMIWCQSLNGDWKFKENPQKEAREEGFWKTDFDTASWDEIPVPGHVQFYGYDQINYANKQYQWDGREDLLPPQLPLQNPSFCYVRHFHLQEALQDKKLELVFHGVETAFYVWVNGAFVGYSEDSFTPARFDITDLVNPRGENTIAVEVFKYSTATWIQDQDMFRFSGIFRDVELYGWPRIHVRDLYIRSETAENLHEADVTLKLKMAGDQPHSFRLQLLNAKGDVVQKYAFQEDTFTFHMEGIHLWSAEDPYLYRLMLEVLDEQGQVVEVIPQTFGLRRFELKDGLMLLNGKRMVFRGINRHEFKHTSGHVMDKETMEWDARFMKAHNINAVRTSHYPNNSYWYELCDRYGLYMIDEANLEAHGMWDKLSAGKITEEQMVPGSNPAWKEVLLDRAQNMVERDKNHPSILIWSPGNESWTGENLNAMTAYLMDRQDGRLVQYEGCYWNPDKQWEVETQVESRMYPPAAVIEEYLKSSPKKPYINIEYSHAMGNSLGDLNSYIDLEERYDQYQGGFIWDYADQAILYQDRYGQDVLGYGGDFKDRQTEYNFSGDGVLFANRSLSPKVQEMKYQYQDMKLTPTEKGVRIKNKALFTNSEAYDIVYTLEKEGQILQRGVVESHVAPGKEEEVQIPWKTDIPGEVVKTVKALLKEDRLYAPKGHEHAIGYAAQGVFEELPEEKGKVRLVEGERETGVFTGNMEIKFQGGLGVTSLRFDGQEYIARPGKPWFFRAPTDNEAGYHHETKTALWMGASQYSQIETMEASLNEAEDEAVIRYVYQLPGVEARSTVTYTIRYPGIVRVTVDWPGQKGLPELPIFAHNFRLYKDTDQFTFYGQGPDENYPDRNEGARLGVFQGNAVENMTPYLLPQEAGNRTGIRWLEVTDSKGQGLRFTMKEKPFQASVLPYDSLTITAAYHQEELPRPYYTMVTIAGENMGVGGDDSWGSPVLPQYCIPSDQPLHFSFEISQAGK